jgi:cytochrome c oxidase subunit III
MPGTLTDDIEITHSGQGGGIDVPAGGDDDGGSGEGGAQAVPRRPYFTAISLGLAAILMFFMALTSSYIVRKGLGGDWQPIRLPSILWFNTLVLLVSSGTIEVARRHHQVHARDSFRRWWALTTGLGIVFLLGQVEAWRHLRAAGVFLASNPASSFYYVLTAAHGLHLMGGIVALLYVLFRAWQRSRITQGTAAELTSIYWHFMDGLWVFLFLLLHLGR